VDGFVGAKMFDMIYSPVVSPRLAAVLPDQFNPSVLERTTLLHENDYEGWTKWLSAEGLSEIAATSGWVFEDPGTMIETAAAGEGIALGPFPLLDELVQSGRLVRVFGRSISTQSTYFLAISGRSLEKPGIKLFWDWLSQDGFPSYSCILEQQQSSDASGAHLMGV